MVFRDSKRWKEALECGSEACRCPDANRWTFHSYADTLSKLERNREAAEVLIGAIALDPSPFLFAKLGFQFLQLRRDHDAEFVLGLVTDLKPGDTNADAWGEFNGYRNGFKAFWLRDDFLDNVS